MVLVSKIITAASTKPSYPISPRSPILHRIGKLSGGSTLDLQDPKRNKSEMTPFWLACLESKIDRPSDEKEGPVREERSRKENKSSYSISVDHKNVVAHALQSSCFEKCV